MLICCTCTSLFPPSEPALLRGTSDAYSFLTVFISLPLPPPPFLSPCSCYIYFSKRKGSTQLPSARTISCCPRRCRPACPCRYPVVPPRHDSLPSSLSLSPPHFDCCRAACKLQHCSRASVDIADANPQYIATASVIGLQLLQVTAPAPAAFPACASRRLLRRWMPAHRGRWSPAARSGSRCTPSPPLRRVHPKSPLRTVINVCCAAGGVGAHAHEQRQQHSRSIRCTSPAHLAALPPRVTALYPLLALLPPRSK